MASIKFNGVDAINASFEALAQVSDEEILSILRPAAVRLQEAHRQAIKDNFVQRTGALHDSIQIEQKRESGRVFYRVLPKGKHPRPYLGKRNRTKPYNREPADNATIAFVLEHGSPRIAARHWMEKANDKVRDELNGLIEKAWNDYLARKGG